MKTWIIHALGNVPDVYGSEVSMPLSTAWLFLGTVWQTILLIPAVPLTFHMVIIFSIWETERNTWLLHHLHIPGGQSLGLKWTEIAVGSHFGYPFIFRCGYFAIFLSQFSSRGTGTQAVTNLRCRYSVPVCNSPIQALVSAISLVPS